MYFKVLLVVASLLVLGTARPTDEAAEDAALPTLVLEKEETEDLVLVTENEDGNLQLVDLDDTTASTPPPSVVVPRRRSSGYGRKKRESSDEITDDASQEILAQNEEEPAHRDFGDLARLLSIAGAKPQAVDPSGSYSGRRRRSAEDDEEVAVVVVDQSAEVDEEPAPRDFGDLARLLRIAGAKPQAVDLSGSYSGRKRRSDDNLYGLVPEVSVDAVKIKSHGKNGQQVQNSATGTPTGRAIFEPSYSARVRRADFITFNEYDQRRVKTLKIEQNDFLALPKRLEQEEEQTDRQKRKFKA